MAAAIQTSALTDTVVDRSRNLNETYLHLKGQSSAPVTVLDKGGRGSHFCSAPYQVVVGLCSMLRRSCDCRQDPVDVVCSVEIDGWPDDGLHFPSICQELRRNRNMVLGALHENGLMLEHASQDLRGSEQMMCFMIFMETGFL